MSGCADPASTKRKLFHFRGPRGNLPIMRVCIDIQSAVTQRAGVGRYTRELVKYLGPMADADAVSLFYFDFLRRGKPFDAPATTMRSVRWCPGRMAQHMWKSFNWPPFDVFAGPAELYHFPNFVLPPLAKGKSVVTIHDMSFIRYPEYAEEANQKYLAARIKDTAARADAIITISRFSADEIQTFLRVDSARLFPTHLGISHAFKAPPPEAVDNLRKRYQLDRPYILTVGTLEPRKNLQFLVDVFDKLDHFDGYLVLAGMPGWKYEPIFERIRLSHRAGNIKWLKYVPDSDLPALYAGAQLFMLTSLYEGFGFPPLESMACGTPVVCSAGGSLSEVVENAAVLVDSFESDRWAELTMKAITDTDFRRTLVSRGIEQSGKYTWEATARKTWEVYRKVAG
ncbi:MAG: hypothetical protein C0404_00385 [Verrucomicrobia bacterium]|nr:hypothetical protein [Verrucomicrobiota bacterium]